MSSSFRTKVFYYISLIAIVAWLGICAAGVAYAQIADDADITVSVPEPSLAALTGLGIAGVALVRWLRKR
jgi:hypothetical protein